MNIKAILTILIITLISCAHQKEPQVAKLNPIIGTWELISSTTIQGDSFEQTDLTDKKMIKIINETHFAFLNHDINKDADSLNYFVSGGGKYQFSGNQYIEFLEYCNYREWEGNKFEFTVEFRGDTLIQEGIEKIEELGVDRRIVETYLKTKN
jgi:hypothetical protein